MDGLALLCNLFADGPVTLRRLRAASLKHLAELERAEPAALAEVLHSSVSQARAFAEEARKLVRRLAEVAPAPRMAQAAKPAPERFGRVAVETASISTRVSGPPPTAGAEVLTPGLFAGLDEALCARLARHQVRTVQALGEFAGLTLARRTGIPYSTLLELSRASRRHAEQRTRARQAPPSTTRTAPPRDVTLVPFRPEPKRAPSEIELTSTDGFTLPLVEPEAAGPFV